MVHVSAAVILFILSIMAHMVYCRFKGIGDIAMTSMLWCCACGGVLYVVLCVTLLPSWGSGAMPLSGGALFCALVPFYVSFYHSTVVNSPTRIMIEACLWEPRTEEELLGICLKADFIGTRLEALIAHGIIRREGKVLQVTARGRVIARALDFYQSVIGRTRGG